MLSRSEASRIAAGGSSTCMCLGGNPQITYANEDPLLFTAGNLVAVSVVFWEKVLLVFNRIMVSVWLCSISVCYVQLIA